MFARSCCDGDEAEEEGRDKGRTQVLHVIITVTARTGWLLGRGESKNGQDGRIWGAGGGNSGYTRLKQLAASVYLCRWSYPM